LEKLKERFKMEYLIHLIILIGIYLILAQAFNLVFGLGLLFNLAHIATYALGAYTVALLTVDHAFSWYLALFFALSLSGIFALLIGAISLRLSSDYFAIGTLALSSVISALLVNWKSVTRGVLGIPGIPRPEVMSFDLYNNSNFAVFVWSFTVLVLAFLFIIFHSPLARSLRAQSQHLWAAKSLGLETVHHSIIAFVLSSILAGLAGGLFAFYMSYIDPSSFMLTEMVLVLTICILGKPGAFWGTIYSTVFLVLLPEALRFTELPPSILGPMRQLIYAVILFLVVYRNRRTLFPMQRTL
jgi:branched-chain amino acid transport system permease protein